MERLDDMETLGEIVADNYQGPGIYEHYKGGMYEVLGLAVHEHAKDHNAGWHPDSPKYQQVIYRPLTPGGLLDDTSTDFWIRRLDVFNTTVDLGDGHFVARFMMVKRNAF